MPATPQPGPGTNHSCLPITQNSEENDEWPQVTEGYPEEKNFLAAPTQQLQLCGAAPHNSKYKMWFPN